MNDIQKRLPLSRLGLKILLYFFIAFAVAAGIFLILNYTLKDIIYNRFTNTQADAEQVEQEINNFKEFVTANNVSTENMESVDDWVYNEKFILMNVYRDDYLIYSNYIGDGSKQNGHLHKSKTESYIPLYRRLYNVDFSDATCQVGVFILTTTKINDTVLIIEIVFSFAVFLLIFIIFLSSKFKYISRLKNEMEIIGSGNLGLPVTIKGSDEIAFLAKSIDEMRKSFLERIKNEDEARRANSELITSISHDLRTPLTILIGNLDVVAEKKYKNEEQYERYIENCRKKAYQIKELSDKLFEYFLVTGGMYKQPELAPVNGTDVINQMISEYALSLKDHGYSVSVNSEEKGCVIKANLIAVRRVLDNLFGNIEKYALPNSLVDIEIKNEDLMLFLHISNLVRETGQNVKSTNIGLTTCEKIMAQHNGIFKIEREQGRFCVTIGFPIIKA